MAQATGRIGPYKKIWIRIPDDLLVANYKKLFEDLCDERQEEIVRLKKELKEEKQDSQILGELLKEALIKLER